MAEIGLNNIIFKIEGSSNSTALNTGSAQPVSAPGVSGTVTAAAINLSDARPDTGLILNGDAATTSNRLPINGDRFPLSQYIINDSTENLFSVNFVTNNEGYFSIDITEMLKNTKFIRFYQKYRGQITLNITIEIPKTATYNVFVDNVKITIEFKETERGINFDGYSYYEKDGALILSPIEDRVTELATLRRTYKTVEDNYLLVKKQFESQVTGDIDLEIDTAETYEPKTFKNVITRLLEFQSGTLHPAIAYTKTAKLTTENERLTIIDNLVNLLAQQYPDITIEDGEGIPYNTSSELTAEA